MAKDDDTGLQQRVRTPPPQHRNNEPRTQDPFLTLVIS